MSYVIILKLINRISIVFAILQFIFGLGGSERVSGIFYIWVCIISFGISYFIEKKQVLSIILSVLMFIPLIFVKSTDGIIFEAAIILFCIYICVRNVLNSDYELEIDAFKKGLLLFFMMLLASIVTISVHILESYSAQYILIYLVSSVVIMRTMRLLKYSSDNIEGERVNKRYTICMIAFSAIMCIEAVKKTIIKGISFACNIIIKLIGYVLYWLIIGVGYAVEFIVNKLNKLLKISLNDIDDNLFKNLLEKNRTQNKKEGYLAEYIFNSPVLKIILRIALVLLILYFVLKLIKGMAIKREEENGYVEDKEFIKREKKGYGGLIKKISMSIRPKNPGEYIRYYYQRFMNLCIKKGVFITNKDTTREINDKSKVEFDEGSLEDIRGIYIKTRYSKDDASKEMMENFKKNYRNIKKGK